jgi:hypothetical protein
VPHVGSGAPGDEEDEAAAAIPRVRSPRLDQDATPIEAERSTSRGHARRYLTPALLILDDFALRDYTVSQTENIYELVSRRYRRGS